VGFNCTHKSREEDIKQLSKRMKRRLRKKYQIECLRKGEYRRRRCCCCGYCRDVAS